MKQESAKENIIRLVQEAEAFIPIEVEDEEKSCCEITADFPNWHPYENEIWRRGEEVRRLMKSVPSLWSDKELYELYLSIVLNKKAKRGRQTFILLFAYDRQSSYAEALASQIEDRFVCGHIIQALRKMKAFGYPEAVAKYQACSVTWIRNEAKKYMQLSGKAMKDEQYKTCRSAIGRRKLL